MAQEKSNTERQEFTVVLSGIELSDEQRYKLSEAIQKAALGVLPEVQWRPLDEDAPPELLSLLAPERELAIHIPLLGMVGWPPDEPPFWEV
jgi:hypothetical protein